MLMDNGQVMSFGSNYYGELGRSTNLFSNNPNPTPTIIPGVSGVKDIAAGGWHSIIVMEDGRVMSFGYNKYGQLGKPANTTVNPTPTLIANVTGVKKAAASNFYTLLLLNDGQVMSFGYNRYGELGRTQNSGNSNPNFVAMLIPGVSGVKDIAVGDAHSILLLENGRVMSFGYNYYGELGRNVKLFTGTANPTPIVIPNVSGIMNVTAGGSHSLLINGNDEIMSFGRNNAGQLGRTENFTANFSPTTIIFDQE